MFTLPNYKIGTIIYESANSLVYRGVREEDNQPIILKVLKQDYPSPEELTRYRQEYEINHDLDLIGVIKTYAIEKYQNTNVIILEDFGGESLKTTLEKEEQGRMSVSDFLPLAIQIAFAMSQIHTANIIHKDINPANIIWNKADNQLKIIDFGIASRLPRENPFLKNPEQLEGTLAYISPEQTGRMNRVLDYRTDLYSLGVTFYELLTGKIPFESDSAMELVHCHIAKTPVPLSEINPDVLPIIEDIVMKLMAKNIEDRYQSAFGVKADLEACQLQFAKSAHIDFFQIAQNDFSGHLQIPQKLYGRENEINTLLQAFEGVTEGAGKMILLAGYSGVGKTALVHEVHKPMTSKNGYFAAGKFDQFQRNVPYSGLTQAFNEFCRYLLTESAEVLNQWRNKILKAVGNNGQVLIEVIGQLELVIGPQPAVAQVGPIEAQNRFNLFFKNFFQAICHKNHPLVLFIDDLQWADSASLNLLEILMTDSDSQYFLIIGAYRDNEVEISHPLMMTVEKLQKQAAFINTISLHNLSQTNVNTLVAETLICKPAYTQPLTQLVYEKTQGNAFFTREFLKSLYEQDLLGFDFKTQKWQWNIDQIKALSITDNVVELITSKINKLPVQTQEVLKLASCIGNLFDLETVSIIYQHSQAESLAHLWKALEDALLYPLDNTYKLNMAVVETMGLKTRIKFQHDRIQQAAYALIKETDKAALHLKIGRLLKANADALENQLFEIVDHLNLGNTRVDNPIEQYDIARLNLKAGQKAKAATAYEAAVKYLMVGISLLNEDCWQTDYELTLALHVEAVEATYFNGDYEQLQQFTVHVLQNAKTVLEKVRVYKIQILFHSAENRMQEAIDTGLEVLALLGVTLADKPPQNLDVEKLAHLPLMTDQKKQAALHILMMLFAPIYTTQPSLLANSSFTMVDLCVKYGKSSLAAYAYVVYGVFLSGVLGKIELGYQFGQLALKTLDQFDTRKIQCRVYNNFYSFTIHWKELARFSLEPLEKAIQIGLETGEVEFTCYASVNYCNNISLIGVPLELAHQKQLHYFNLIRKLKQLFQLYYIQIWGQFVLNLMDSVPQKTVLTGYFFNEEESLPILIENKNVSSLYCFYLVKTILHYLFKEFPQAVENGKLAEQNENGMVGLLPAGYNAFYYSLALLAQYPNLEKHQQITCLEKVAYNQNRLQQWASHAPMNFQHKYDLVEAEKARVLGELSAIESYEKAIAGAFDNEYLNEEALAYELAAEFYLGRGMEKFAQTYLKEAHYRYQQWGAVAKEKDLEDRYPQWLSHKSSTPAMPTWQTRTSTMTIMASIQTQVHSSNWLDLESVMKATQTLSGEIVLKRLLEKMMQIVIENAGAQRGFLVLQQDEKWFIEAEGVIDKEEVSTLHSLPVENHLPEAIISYVARTQENVVLKDARQEGLYTENAYIKTHQTQSLLCFPIVYQQQLRAILYLENNLTTGAFTETRLNMLKMLSSQMAISLENAQFMAHLDSKVKNRTSQLNAKVEELTQTRQELVQSEKMASLGRLVAGFAHELNTPLGVAIGSASALQNQTKKINRLMEEEEVDVDELLSALESIDKGSHLTLSNLERAANLVTSFKRTAIDQTSDEVRSFLVHEVINDTIQTLHNRFKKTQIEISVECLTGLKVKSLPGALEQILTNFLINSLIHGFNEGKNAGLINIKVQRVDGKRLHLEYADNGKGIIQENLAKIFEPFFTTYRAEGGSGLGMYICYNIVTTQLQGTISCESVFGKGVVFKIDYPIL